MLFICSYFYDDIILSLLLHACDNINTSLANTMLQKNYEWSLGTKVSVGSLFVGQLYCLKFTLIIFLSHKFININVFWVKD